MLFSCTTTISTNPIGTEPLPIQSPSQWNGTWHGEDPIYIKTIDKEKGIINLGIVTDNENEFLIHNIKAQLRIIDELIFINIKYGDLRKLDTSNTHSQLDNSYIWLHVSLSEKSLILHHPNSGFLSEQKNTEKIEKHLLLNLSTKELSDLIRKNKWESIIWNKPLLVLTRKNREIELTNGSN